MIGCYDFCGHYEWTFEWLRAQGGHDLVRAYWDEAIHQDSQLHASMLIEAKGIEGMKEYWGPTRADEGAVYERTVTDDAFRIDIDTVAPARAALEERRRALGRFGPRQRAVLAILLLTVAAWTFFGVKHLAPVALGSADGGSTPSAS